MGARTTLPSGAVRLQGELTKAGVFEYVRPSGQVVREYRPAEEIARADALASIEDLPVTVGHPRVGVSAATLDSVSAGHVRSPVLDGATVRGTLTVNRSDARKGVLDGKLVETSMGYDCRLDETPGVTADGQRYDAVQRDLTYNHVALLPQGGARLGTRLDGADGERVSRLDGAGNQIWETPVKIKVKKADGKEVELEQGSPEHIAHLEARADAAEAKATALDAELATYRADAAKSARADLEKVAAGVVGKTFKADGKTDAQIKAEVIAARLPSVKLDGKTEAYVDAMFDAALATVPAPKPAGRSQVAVAASLARADEFPFKKKGEDDEDEDEMEKKAAEAKKKADSAWERN